MRVYWGSDEERARREPTYFLKMLNPETRATLEQLYQQPEFKVLCIYLCGVGGPVYCDVMCVCVCVCVGAGEEGEREEEERDTNCQDSCEDRLGGVVLQFVCLQAHYSTGAVAHSFTSTATAPVTENEAAIIDRDALRYAKVKKKGASRWK